MEPEEEARSKRRPSTAHDAPSFARLPHSLPAAHHTQPLPHVAARRLAQTAPHFRRLNDAVVQLLDDFAMVTFTPLDISDEESVEDLLLQIDMAIQVGALFARRPLLLPSAAAVPARCSGGGSEARRAVRTPAAVRQRACLHGPRAPPSPFWPRPVPTPTPTPLSSTARTRRSRRRSSATWRTQRAGQTTEAAARDCERPLACAVSARPMT